MVSCVLQERERERDIRSSVCLSESFVRPPVPYVIITIGLDHILCSNV